jgi:argininosuccinate lyase
MLRLITDAFCLVIFKLHFGIITIPQEVSTGNCLMPKPFFIRTKNERK